MGKLFADEGRIRVIAQVDAYSSTHLVVKRVPDGREFLLRLSGLPQDARLGDVGQIVDIEAIKTSSDDYSIRHIVCVDGELDVETLEKMQQMHT